MASGSARKSGGGDRVVGSRHLIGLFLGVVLLCGVFFTLGYVMGHAQYGDSSMHASSAPAKEKESPSASAKNAASAPASTDSPEWDFYPSKKSGGSAAVLTKASDPSTLAPAAKPVAIPVKPLARYHAPRIPRGALVLQVAALKSESDALALTDALQQKRFPAFVVTPAGDNLYRVQVGPYADPQSANQAKTSLEREGFKAILKR
jgi:DedD protein